MQIYEGYYFTGINATVLREIDGELYFGTASGDIKSLLTDYTQMMVQL